MCMEYLAAVQNHPVDISEFNIPLDDLERKRVLRAALLEFNNATESS